MVRSCVRVFVLVAYGLPVGAQWLDYPNAGIPRTSDGNPLGGACPKDSGWRTRYIRYLATRAACSPQGCAQFVSDYPIGQEFRNFGWKLPGGLPYQPWAAELFKLRSAQLGEHDPVALCRPGGALRFLTFPPPRRCHSFLGS